MLARAKEFTRLRSARLASACAGRWDGALGILVLLGAPRRYGGPRARRARADDHLEILTVLSDDALLPKVVLARVRLRRGFCDVLPRHVRTLSLRKQRTLLLSKNNYLPRGLVRAHLQQPRGLVERVEHLLRVVDRILRVHARDGAVRSDKAGHCETLSRNRETPLSSYAEHVLQHELLAPRVAVGRVPDERAQDLS